MAALGRGRKSLKAFDRDVDWYRTRFGVVWEVVDARDIHTIVDGDHFNVALYEPEGIGVHPARLAFGLATEVRLSGAVLVDYCRAASMEKTGAGMAVYIIVTEPLGEERASEIFPGGAMTHTRKRLLNYMRRTPDDRILIGGRRISTPGSTWRSPQPTSATV